MFNFSNFKNKFKLIKSKLTGVSINFKNKFKLINITNFKNKFKLIKFKLIDVCVNFKKINLGQIICLLVVVVFLFLIIVVILYIILRCYCLFKIFFGYVRRYYLYDKPEPALYGHTDLTNLLFIPTEIHLKRFVRVKGWLNLFYYILFE